MPRSSFLRPLVLTGLAAAVIAGSFGCSNGSTRRDRMIRANLTPELRTLHQRPVDVSNAIALTFDENGRMINQDLGRVFYTNRPSRLTPEPIPR